MQIVNLFKWCDIEFLLTKHGSGSWTLLEPSSAWSMMKQTGSLPSQTSFLAAWSTIVITSFIQPS